jgi:hypothetical protein|tara:strand:+ start:5410 stop:5637 length:228 start_codon:yes stop_codon:yes gene_type:complete
MICPYRSASINVEWAGACSASCAIRFVRITGSLSQVAAGGQVQDPAGAICRCAITGLQKVRVDEIGHVVEDEKVP